MPLTRSVINVNAVAGPTQLVAVLTASDVECRPSLGNCDDVNCDDELNLYCSESLTPSHAADDRKRVDGDNRRVLNVLLDAETKYQLTTNPYDGRMQPEINEMMREQLADWISKVKICTAFTRSASHTKLLKMTSR